MSELLNMCKKLKVYDPAGMDNAKKMSEFNGVEWCQNAWLYKKYWCHGVNYWMEWI